MTSPRPSISEEDKKQLKNRLLGDSDNNVLKSLVNHIRRKSEEASIIKAYGEKTLSLFRDQIDFQSMLDSKGKYSIPDGEIIAIIRKDIEESIEKGYIKTEEQGAKQIKAYMDIIKAELEKTPPNPNLKTDIVNAVKNQTGAALEKKAMLQEAKNMYAHLYRGIQGQSRLVTMKNRSHHKLQAQEKTMISLGATKKELEDFKTALKTEAIKNRSPSITSQRPSTIVDSTNSTEPEARKSPVTKR